MKFRLENLRKDEQLPLILGELFAQFGYKKFKMEKFEEYDFYAKNKNFLKSHKIITFPNSEGKLVALKPDITLSIIKNAKAEENKAEKRYYNESVYRHSKYTGEFSEISQTGLEYMGNITIHTMAEILGLAMKSLEFIEKDYVLSVAHVDFLTEIIEDSLSDTSLHSEILNAFSAKNSSYIDALTLKGHLTEENALRIKSLMNIYGTLEECLPQMKELIFNERTQKAYSQFEKIAEAFSDTEYKNHLKLDFSIITDTTYYNGLVFQGYTKSVPHSVLSGGRYDKLFRLMKDNTLDAMGFAIYLDNLERYIEKEKENFCDTMILYNEESDIKIINKVINEQAKLNKTFFAEKYIPENVTFSKVITILGKEIKEENYND